MYTNEMQEKSAVVWRYFLGRVKELLSQAKGRKRKKELRSSVRALESLIRERALLPEAQFESQTTESCHSV